MSTHLCKTAAAVLITAWMAVGQEYQAAFSTTVEEVGTFLGTRNAKLAYVNFHGDTKALHFIDFSQGSGAPTIQRIPAAVNPTSPIVSPDGRWVVFASAPGVYGEPNTPVSTRTSVYICKLEQGAQPVLVAADSACEPRFVQNPGDNMLTVVYPTLAPDEAWAKGVGKTMIAKIDTAGGTPSVASREVLFEHAAYTAGLSYDNRYLGGSGGEVAMTDVQRGTAEFDTVTHIYTDQACNGSISTSRIHTNTMMYLDFGTAGKSVPLINNGQPWVTWQVIVIGDPSRGILNAFTPPLNPEHPYQFEDTTFEAPSSTTKYETFLSVIFHHPEWSNHPYFATATLNIDRKYHYAQYENPDWDDGSWQHTYWQERVVLIDLKNRAFHEVVRPAECCYLDETGRGFYWPSLWVEVPQGFTEDPQDWLLPVASWTSPGRAIGGMRLERGTIVSQRPLTSVAVHDLLGRCLGKVSLRAGQRRVSVSPFLRTSGTVVVRAHAGETSQTWRVTTQN